MYIDGKVSRLSKNWQSLKYPKNTSILSKPDHAHIFTISGVIQLEYFSEDYDEECKMESSPERNREVTPPLRTRSPRVQRQRERVVGFEEVSNREGIPRVTDLQKLEQRKMKGER
ncbi:hypothetical protein Tco_0390978 [Tanacetum coccineum]